MSESVPLVQKKSAGGGARIEIQGLSKRFQKGDNRIDVLRNVDLVMGAGERVAIVGPSGSGKSTLLQILGTLDRPSEGTVLLDGQNVFRLPAREIDRIRNQRIGFVFQFHHLLPDQTAMGNVALPLVIGGAPRSEANDVAAARLKRVGLGHRLTHFPGELSGGEQQRVALARAMVMNPGVLLADEPTGNLDPKTADGVFQLLLELNEEQGSTLVVVTHSHALAKRFERRLEVVDGGLEDWS
ncbi:MAG: ABC transporter ATP-binding protein [Proteobacteria bacterium]|nr:ABC transporter ATP-binding protein [Pseudomonadota bacterium]MCP4920682.1 ABC transporter ATP-binding protein [Pseudomonadota bacterium]